MGYFMPDYYAPILSQYPPYINRADPERECTLGDLHGNTAKLLYTLVSEGILQVSSEDYQKLIAIYKASPLGADLNEFDRILENAHYNPVKVFRLIGDVLADRGQDDLLTLIVLDKLAKKGIQHEILFSNHDAVALSALSLIKQNPTLASATENITCAYQNISESASIRSLTGLLAHVENRHLEVGALLTLAQNAYVSKMKLFSYTLHNDGTLSIYTHTPGGLETLRAVANNFCVSYDDSNAQTLAATINEVNRSFATALAKDSMPVPVDPSQQPADFEKRLANLFATSAWSLNKLNAIVRQTPNAYVETISSMNVLNLIPENTAALSQTIFNWATPDQGEVSEAEREEIIKVFSALRVLVCNNVLDAKDFLYCFAPLIQHPDPSERLAAQAEVAKRLAFVFNASPKNKTFTAQYNIQTAKGYLANFFTNTNIPISIDFPLYKLAWNRNLSNELQSKPFIREWVHGHIGCTVSPVQIRFDQSGNSLTLRNIDNTLGKNPLYIDNPLQYKTGELDPADYLDGRNHAYLVHVTSTYAPSAQALAQKQGFIDHPACGSTLMGLSTLLSIDISQLSNSIRIWQPSLGSTTQTAAVIDFSPSRLDLNAVISHLIHQVGLTSLKQVPAPNGYEIQARFEVSAHDLQRMMQYAAPTSRQPAPTALPGGPAGTRGEFAPLPPPPAPPPPGAAPSSAAPSRPFSC